MSTNETKHTPELEPHCGSWIITRTDTGAAVLETHSRKVADASGICSSCGKLLP